MKKIEWNNKQGSRDRLAVAVIVTADGGVHRFKGSPIPNVCHSQQSAYEKSGKWSNTTYMVTMADETVFVSFRQDWNTGQTWPQLGWDEAFEWLRTQAPLADKAKFEQFIRTEYAKTATRFDEQRKAEEAFSTPVLPPVPENPAG